MRKYENASNKLPLNTHLFGFELRARVTQKPKSIKWQPTHRKYGIDDTQWVLSHSIPLDNCNIQIAHRFQWVGILYVCRICCWYRCRGYIVFIFLSLWLLHGSIHFLWESHFVGNFGKILFVAFSCWHCFTQDAIRFLYNVQQWH